MAYNFPYEGPKNLYELLTRGTNRYKENYDRAFEKKALKKKRKKD